MLGVAAWGYPMSLNVLLGVRMGTDRWTDSWAQSWGKHQPLAGSSPSLVSWGDVTVLVSPLGLCLIGLPAAGGDAWS